MKKTARMISFEGGEGAGKSSMINLLMDGLRTIGIDVIQTREPGGSVGAEQIRQFIVTGDPERWDGMTEAFLFFAARRDHFIKTIEPALREGKWVICDRFIDSSVVYQRLRGCKSDDLNALTRMALGDFRPDLTFLIDICPTIGLERAWSRMDSENRFEQMNLEFHKKVRAGFLEIAAQEVDRIKIVDGSRPPSAVQDEIRRHLSTSFGISI